MTRNLRTQLASLAERWLNSWGYNLTREQAALLLKAWDLAEPWDDETVAEVLGRFPAAEPPAVPGLDWLPETQADADVLVAETVAALDDCTCDLNLRQVCDTCQGVSADRPLVDVPAPVKAVDRD